MENQNSILGTESQPAVPATSDEKTMALLAHVLTFVAWLIPPLIIYLIKKDESEFVKEHAKESMNFQITLAIASLILIITVVGIFLLWIVGIASLVLRIVATLRASEGKLYRYPLTIRLIK